MTDVLPNWNTAPIIAMKVRKFRQGPTTPSARAAKLSLGWEGANVPKHEGPVVGHVNDLSLVDRIFTSFIDALAVTEGCSEIGERLRVTLLDDRDMSEAALDRALFDVHQP